MNIQFLGATKEVTGSKHLITTKSGLKILLDCGMYQGKGLETDSMNRDLGFNPSEIDYLILSHAHIDHSGLIPYIYALGFSGTILCTPGTRDLCSILLPDAGRIQESDTVQFNRKRDRQGLPPVEPIFKEEDAYKALGLFISVPYHKEFKIGTEVVIKFTDAGHILGSAVINLTIKEGRKKRNICFTGDIGRYNKQILKDPEAFPQADYIIMESTYGDRLHTNNDTAEQELYMAVLDTCMKKKGKLIIPAFAVGRAQEIIYTLDRLKTKGLLPDIDTFVDSPLSISATNIMRLHPEAYNQKILEYMQIDSDPFGFDRLHYVKTIEDSKRLNSYNKPCIIISASGMMEAGRIKHHLANNIEDKRTTILVAGYCSPRTLGAKIARGEKKVSIFGHLYHVNAEVRRIESYSGHADYKEMLQFMECQDKKKVKEIFLVHGEESVQENFANTLRKEGFKNVSVPNRTEIVTI